MINSTLHTYQEKFAKANNINEFIEAFQFSENKIAQISGQRPMTINPSIIGYLLMNKNQLYHEFSIRKKTGGKRKINAPNVQLAFVQRRIKTILALFYNAPENWFRGKEWENEFSQLFQPAQTTHGFINNRSIVTNANNHVGRPYVLNLDLKDFFPSVGTGKIIKTLQTEPFNFSYFSAQLIANLCTLDNKLPQGSPASPILSNLVSRRLDYQINKLCEILPTTRYTRYVDDITISSEYNIFDKAFLAELEKEINTEGFNINLKKTRLQIETQRQEVTGLIVNEKVNVPRKRIRLIRSMLFNWRTLGYDEAQKTYQKANRSKSDLSLVLWGHLCFIKMVRGNNDYIYQKYLTEFNKLKSLK